LWGIAKAEKARTDEREPNDKKQCPWENEKESDEYR
jgi:hypothetical protein